MYGKVKIVSYCDVQNISNIASKLDKKIVDYLRNYSINIHKNGGFDKMNKGEKRKEFVKKLKEVNSLMNWCKIKINPDETEEIDDSEIKKDYVYWKEDDDHLFEELCKDRIFEQLSTIEKILKIHCLVCKYFVFDDFCYFLGNYNKEKNICAIDSRYGRNPNSVWIENRKKHNRRICYELSRYMAVRLKQFIKEESDIFLVSDEYETHYATAYVCDDFMIIIDTDDYWKGADLNRVKLGLEIKGITIVSDEKNIVKEKLNEINKTRKSKKEFEKEIEDDPVEKSRIEWINILLEKIKIIDNDGIFKYMYTILEMKGYEPKKIWEKEDTIYKESLYMRWNMKFMVINSSGIKILSDREFNDYIHEGKYLHNKERYTIAERMEYDGR